MYEVDLSGVFTRDPCEVVRHQDLIILFRITKYAGCWCIIISVK